MYIMVCDRETLRRMGQLCYGVMLVGVVMAACLWWTRTDDEAPPHHSATAPAAIPVVTTRPATLAAIRSRPTAVTTPAKKLIRVDSPGKLTWHAIRKLPGVARSEAWPVTSGLTVRWLIPEDSKVRKYIRFQCTDEDPGHQSLWYTMAPCRIAATGKSGRVYSRTLPVKRLLQWREKTVIRYKPPPKRIPRGGDPRGKYAEAPEGPGSRQDQVILGPADPLGFSIDIWRPVDAPEHAKLLYDADTAWDPAVDKPVLIQFIVGDEFSFEWRDRDVETGP